MISLRLTFLLLGCSLLSSQQSQPSAQSREIKLDKYYSLKIFVSSRSYVRCDIAPTRIFKPGVDRFNHEDRKHALKAAKFYEYLSKAPQECSIGNIVKPSRVGVAGGGKLFLTDGYQQGLLERALVGSDGRVLFAEIYPLRSVTGIITRPWEWDLGEAGGTVYIDGFRFFVPEMTEDLQHEGRSVSLLAAGPIGGGWGLAQEEPTQPLAHSSEINLDKHYSLKIFVSSRGYVRCDMAPSHIFKINDNGFAESDHEHALEESRFRKYLAMLPPECSLGKELRRAPVGLHGAGKNRWTDHYEGAVLERTTVENDRVAYASVFPFRKVTGTITSPSQCDLNSNSVVNLAQISLCSVEIDGFRFLIPEDQPELRSTGHTVTTLAAGPVGGWWGLGQEEPAQPFAHSSEINLDKYYSLKIFVSSRGYVRCDVAPSHIFKTNDDGFDEPDHKHALKESRFRKYLAMLPSECSLGKELRRAPVSSAGGGKDHWTDHYQRGVLERTTVEKYRTLYASVYPLREVTGVITSPFRCDLVSDSNGNPARVSLCFVHIDGFRFFIPEDNPELRPVGQTVTILAAGPIGEWGLAQEEPRRSFE